MTGKLDWGARFLYAEDLIRGGRFVPFTLTVAAVHEPNTLRAADGKAIDKVVLGFRETPKLLAMCKTNIRVGQLVTGEPLGPGWVGKRVRVQARTIESFGREDIAVRILPADGMPIRLKLAKLVGKEINWQAPQQQAPRSRRAEPDEGPRTMESQREPGEEG